MSGLLVDITVFAVVLVSYGGFCDTKEILEASGSCSTVAASLNSSRGLPDSRIIGYEGPGRQVQGMVLRHCEQQEPSGC